MIYAIHAPGAREKVYILLWYCLSRRVMISYPNFCSVWWFLQESLYRTTAIYRNQQQTAIFFPFPSEGIPPFPYFEEGREREWCRGRRVRSPLARKGKQFFRHKREKNTKPDYCIPSGGCVERQSYWEVSVRTAAVTAHHSCKPTSTKFSPHELNDLGEQTTSREI